MWLLDEKISKEFFTAMEAGLEPSAEEQADFMAFHSSSETAESRIMTLAGDTAEISVNGILTKKPNIMAQIFGRGNTTYADIVSALSLASGNDDVKNIVLAIDSPGGELAGLFDTMSVMQSITKPIKAIVSSMAASAAYGLASQADEIVAINEATEVGSIGILVQYQVNEDIVSITSSKAPSKAPDVTTEAGKKVVQVQLDGLHDIFVGAIARGRDMHPDTVNKDFGQGAMLLAKEAKEKGMIDDISASVINIGTGPTVTENLKASTEGTIETSNIKDKKIIDKQTNTKGEKMNLEKFKAEHPAVYAEAVAIGETQGEQKARDLATAHLTLGEASGDMETAIKAVTEGTAMTAALTASYQASAMKNQSLAARDEDNPDDLAIPLGAVGSDSLGEQVATELEELTGMDTPKQ